MHIPGGRELTSTSLARSEGRALLFCAHQRGGVLNGLFFFYAGLRAKSARLGDRGE